MKQIYRNFIHHSYKHSKETTNYTKAKISNVGKDSEGGILMSGNPAIRNQQLTFNILLHDRILYNEIMDSACLKMSHIGRVATKRCSILIDRIQPSTYYTNYPRIFNVKFFHMKEHIKQNNGFPFPQMKHLGRNSQRKDSTS